MRAFAQFPESGPLRPEANGSGGGGGRKRRVKVKGKGRMLDGWANRLETLEALKKKADGEETEEAVQDRQVGFDKVVFNFPHVGASPISLV